MHLAALCANKRALHPKFGIFGFRLFRFLSVFFLEARSRLKSVAERFEGHKSSFWLSWSPEAYFGGYRLLRCKLTKTSIKSNTLTYLLTVDFHFITPKIFRGDTQLFLTCHQHKKLVCRNGAHLRHFLNDHDKQIPIPWSMPICCGHQQNCTIEIAINRTVTCKTATS